MKLSSIGHMIQCNQMTTIYQRDMIVDSKVHGANMGPIWGRQDPGGPHGLCYLGSLNSNHFHNIKYVTIFHKLPKYDIKHLGLKISNEINGDNDNKIEIS